jgi:hypothetical protein
MWQELIDVLKKICAVYDDLSRIGEKKRYTLVEVDMKGLAKVLDEEKMAAAKIQNLEKKRGPINKEIKKKQKNIFQKN